MDTESKIGFFLDLMGCCNDVAYWCFDDHHSLVCTNGKIEETFLHAFIVGDTSFSQLLTCGRANGMPLVSSMPLGIEWACVFEKQDDQRMRIHIIGPLFLSDASPQQIAAYVGSLPLSLQKQHLLIHQLTQLPVLPATQFFPYVQMLHYCVTGEKIGFSDIQHESVPTKMEVLEEQLSEDYKKRHAGIYAAETELFRMIEEGNLNFRSALNNAVLRASYSNLTHTGDPVRKAQFVAVTFISLSSRAAIRGGLPPATAYYLANYYEAAISNSTSISSMTNLLHEMYENYIRRVRKCKERSNISGAIQCVCDYIDMHVTDDLSLPELARSVHYTEYYMTRKFKKELGISIWDYINQARVERARSMLADTSITVQAISDTLNYCSRSYFSEVFQKHTGLTPSEYRKVNLKL